MAGGGPLGGARASLGGGGGGVVGRRVLGLLGGAVRLLRLRLLHRLRLEGRAPAVQLQQQQ
jgi:hypothetical protein